MKDPISRPRTPTSLAAAAGGALALVSLVVPHLADAALMAAGALVVLTIFVRRRDLHPDVVAFAVMVGALSIGVDVGGVRPQRCG